MSTAVEFEQIAYGQDASTYGHFWIPATDEPVPVVVLVHGGFWKRAFSSDLMEPLAADLYANGYAVWNIEYGRVGEAKGGWPHTLEHVAAAIDYLAELESTYYLDLDRVSVVGHSAGGHLALWSGSRNLLPEGVPGAKPIVEPKLVIGQGSVSDLYAGAADRIGNGAVLDFLGGTSDEWPERYEIAQPKQGSAEVVVVSGTADDIVAPKYSLRAGLDLAEVLIEGEDHFAHIDPSSQSWAAVLKILPNT